MIVNIDSVISHYLGQPHTIVLLCCSRTAVGCSNNQISNQRVHYNSIIFIFVSSWTSAMIMDFTEFN